MAFSYLIKKQGVDPASGDARLAWQGGAALLFVSLIFPLQFDREWITLGWALEGLALIWLFRKVPHRGLRLVGAGLLCVAFVRLALNPAVLEYHKRSAIRIWNWYLYAYGIATVCVLVGARLFGRPRENLLERIAPPSLFVRRNSRLPPPQYRDRRLFLHRSDADVFLLRKFCARHDVIRSPGRFSPLRFLLIGMKQKMGAVRYAGLALLLITLAKLFLHDLSNLEPALSHRRVHRCRADFDRRFVSVSAFSRAERRPRSP